MSAHNNVVAMPGDSARRNRAQLARLPAPVHTVREAARRQLAELLCKLFEQADDALFKLADQATNNQEQNLYFESMREVRIQRRIIENRFFDRIDEAFASLLKEAKPLENTIPTISDEVSIDSLSLVDNDDLEELVAVEAMAGRANNEFSVPIAHLCQRIDSLVASAVSAKSNPLSPMVLCSGFSSSSEGLDIDIKAKLVLFKLFGKFVMSSLGTLYENLNRLLIEANVQPNIPSARGRGRQQIARAQSETEERGVYLSDPDLSGLDLGGLDLGGVNSNHSGVDGAHNTMAEAMVNGSVVNLAQLLGSARGGASQIRNQPAQTSSLLSALSGLQQQAGIASGRIDVQALLLDALSSAGQPADIRQADSDVINLVNLLFDYILEDSNLAAEMKAQISRLQIPLLKVALADKTFFSHGGHPARRLLNEMASLALGWQESDAGGAPLLKQITATVDQVLEAYESDSSVFADLLANLVSFSTKEARRAAILEQRIVDAESGKAKSENARNEVNAALEAVVGGAVLPESVLALLNDAWSNVLLLILLKQGQESAAWKEGLETAGDIVWSVSGLRSAEDRSRLIAVLPGLLKRIRQGLESISYNPFEMQNLLQSLEKLHLAQLSLKPSSAAPKTAKQTVSVKPQNKAAGEPKPPMAMDQLESLSQAKPAAIGNTKQKLTPSVSATKPTPAVYKNVALKSKPAVDEIKTDAAAPVERDEDDYYLSQVDRLTQGTWFEMVDASQQAFRCRLAAIIKKPGKYIFVNRSGSKVAEMSRASLAQALEEGSLNQLDDGMLFDRALESVIGNLRTERSSAG